MDALVQALRSQLRLLSATTDTVTSPIIDAIDYISSHYREIFYRGVHAAVADHVAQVSEHVLWFVFSLTSRMLKKTHRGVLLALVFLLAMRSAKNKKAAGSAAMVPLRPTPPAGHPGFFAYMPSPFMSGQPGSSHFVHADPFAFSGRVPPGHFYGPAYGYPYYGPPAPGSPPAPARLMLGYEPPSAAGSANPP